MKAGTTGGRKRRKGELADRIVHARVTTAELSEWRAKAAAAGVSLSELLWRAMGRTRELARIGNNLNQIARWANTYKRGAEAVSVVAHLSAIERALEPLSRVRREEERDAP